jgi:hypothetical protein
MAMFLESTTQQSKVDYVSTLSIMEELNDITIDLSEQFESFFHEEYSILTEEIDENKKDEKAKSFRDKVGSTVRNIADKIRVAVVKIKQFLLYYLSKAIGSKKFVRAPQELIRFMVSHSISFMYKDFSSPEKLETIKEKLEKDKAEFEKAKSSQTMFTMSSEKFKNFINTSRKSFEDIESGIKNEVNLSPEAIKLLQACITFALAVIHAITSKTKGLDKESETKE